MLPKTKMALAAAMFAATGSAALAQESNMGNRSPGLTAPGGATQSAPVRRQGRNISTPTDNLMMNVMDRASAPFACGG